MTLIFLFKEGVSQEKIQELDFYLKEKKFTTITSNNVYYYSLEAGDVFNLVNGELGELFGDIIDNLWLEKVQSCQNIISDIRVKI